MAARNFAGSDTKVNVS